jgi:hypothetical protein
MRDSTLLAVGFAGLCLFGAVPAGYADSQIVTGDGPGSYTSPAAGAQQELDALNQLLNSGRLSPTDFQKKVAELGALDKDVVVGMAQGAPPRTSGNSAPASSAPGIDPFTAGASAPLIPGTVNSQVCVDGNGGYNAYYVTGPDNQPQGWNGPHCFSATTPGTYCINAQGASLNSVVNNSGSTPVPLTQVLPDLYYHNGNGTDTPLMSLLPNVYYDDGSAAGKSIMPYLSKMTVKPSADGTVHIPPAADDIQVVADDGTLQPLTRYLPKLNFVDSYGKKWPIAPNLKNTFYAVPSNCVKVFDPLNSATFNLTFANPKPAPAPVPINTVLNSLYYYDGYRAIPLKDELKNVYYDDGSAKGVSIMDYLDKISIHTDPGGHYPMPPPLEMLFVKINGVDKPLKDYVANLYYLDSYGKKWPIAPNLKNIVAVGSPNSSALGS